MNMDEADVETTGFLGNMCGAVQTAFLGCLCVPIAIIIIGWNEQNAVCKEKAFADAKSKHVKTNCEYAATNDDKFVHYSCDVESSLKATYSEWSVTTTGTTPTWELTAKPMFYGYKEESRSEETRSGGTTTKRTCYFWTRDWYTEVPTLTSGRAECTSGEYNAVQQATSGSQYQNAVTAFKNLERDLVLVKRPADGVNLYKVGMPQTKTTGTAPATVTTPDYTSNGFRIPMDDITSINGAVTVGVDIPTTATCTSTICTGYKRNSASEWYRAASGSSSTTGVYVGDIKIGFSAKGGTQVSGIGVQAKDTLTTGNPTRGILISKAIFGGGWICGEKAVFDLETGNMTPEKMFEKLNEELKFLTYFLRAFCFFLLWGAFYCCMSPLVEAPNIIPCCGEFISDLISCAVFFVACGCACMCWMFWTSLFFMLYNPLVGGAFLLISIGIMGFFAYQKYNKNSEGGEDGDDDRETPDEEVQMGSGGMPPPTAGSDLPPGWIAKVDPASGGTYYCFEATGVTQWEVPT